MTEPKGCEMLAELISFGLFFLCTFSCLCTMVIRDHMQRDFRAMYNRLESIVIIGYSVQWV